MELFLGTIAQEKRDMQLHMQLHIQLHMRLQYANEDGKLVTSVRDRCAVHFFIRARSGMFKKRDSQRQTARDRQRDSQSLNNPRLNKSAQITFA